MKRRFSILLPLVLLLLPASAQVADPAKHSYADSQGDRDTFDLAGETVNEARLYNFYQRQADHYMAMAREDLPELLPAYPGLDGGQHGHWGKHNQNNYSDTRWNDVDHGPVLAHVYRSKEITILKALCVKLGARNELSAAFDTQSLSWRAVWQGGFVRFDGFRWGGSRNAVPKGELWFQDKETKGWEGDGEGHFLGNYRHGKQVVMSYEIGGTRILDVAGATTAEGQLLFHRTLKFPEGVPSKGLRLRIGSGLAGSVVSERNATLETRADKSLWLKIEAQGRNSFVAIILRQIDGKEFPKIIPNQDPMPLISGGPAEFPQRLTVSARLGDDVRPYVVDTIPVPFDNPFRTVMQLTGIAFFPNGDALVTVWCGEVWKVSGLGGDLKKVIWNRYATGFNQPIGVHIDEEGIFVLDRGRITRLHDLNDDGEADFHENYADDFGGYNRSHTHTFGLVRTPDKAFHFVQRENILRTSASPKTDREALGVRNCMGAGLWQGRYYIAPQEGTWTPASMIIEVRPGEYYGHEGDKYHDREIATPLCYVPRGVDNSTGGMVEVTSDHWGPFKNRFIGLSYGSGLHYLILRDGSGLRAQGASVPLAGEFRAGTIRGAFSPLDGQLYVVGLDGWGDYSTQDGCFHRVRYTGQTVHKPIGFRVHSNGLRIDFSCELDPRTTHPANYFVQQWNYQYSSQYGSPEFSVKAPGMVGHDRVKVDSVRLLDDKRSLFIEMRALVPSMQMHLRMHMTAADGTKFKTDLFPSILQLGDHFHRKGMGLGIPNKLTVINLPIKRKMAGSKDTTSGKQPEGARELLVEVLGGLQYKQKELRAKAGEALSLKLLNKDVMPHNLVIVNPGRAEEVGTAAFKMLNDPKAAEKHYLPTSNAVVAFTFVTPPGGSHVTHFKAPAKAGRYPFLCTFPGHWQAMQGVLIVE
ncbi:MAG: plastocyanin/azurin family copper-binding protein [Roseibacillus sp.]|nr:plastocyanin/azurin family copper-binding protein [Roseibacillus sp.]